MVKVVDAGEEKEEKEEKEKKEKKDQDSSMKVNFKKYVYFLTLCFKHKLKTL